MEVQFEIRSCLEKKHYVQWYQYVLRKRFYWIALFALVGICYLTSGISTADWIYILVATYLFGYCIWNFYRPWILGKKKFKQEFAYYGEDGDQSVTTFADVLRDVTKDNDTTIPYDKIKEIHISKDLILLNDIRGVAILMDKNGFTKGDLPAFLAFIGEKCPQLKLPKW